MNQTMEKMEKMEQSQCTTLVRVLFGLDSPSPISADPTEIETQIGPLNFFDPTLNDSQKDAIRFALASREIALIHGPPGVSPRFYQRPTTNQLIICRLERRTLSLS